MTQSKLRPKSNWESVARPWKLVFTIGLSLSYFAKKYGKKFQSVCANLADIYSKRLASVIVAKGGSIKIDFRARWICMCPRDDCFVVLIIVCTIIKCAFCVDQMIKIPFKLIWIPVGHTTNCGKFQSWVKCKVP